MTDLQQSVVIPASDHAGELTPAALGTVSVAAGMLARVFVPLFAETDRMQYICAIVASALMLALWAYSEHSFSRESLFGLVSAFAEVALATLGLFNLTSPQTLSKLTGGRVGTIGLPGQP